MWQILCIAGIGFVILEIFTPSMFFLNFALAAFITAVISLFVSKTIWLVLSFFVLSFVSFIFLRPLILSRFSKSTETGIQDKYINKKAKVTEEITCDRGVISIYGERWDARIETGEPIPVGCEVKIIRNESLIMYVEKIK